MSGKRGFAVETIFCETCGDTVEALPDGPVAKGLPEGWVAVKVSAYAVGTGEITSPFRHIDTYYYCCKAHLPAEYLPNPDEEENDG